MDNARIASTTRSNFGKWQQEAIYLANGCWICCVNVVQEILELLRVQQMQLENRFIKYLAREYLIDKDIEDKNAI